MHTIAYAIFFGTLQGITEWLPISSEGIITFVSLQFFENIELKEIIRFALFLHLGTFFAALMYFRKEIFQLLYALFSWKKTNNQKKALLIFLILSTCISGIIGILLFYTLSFISFTKNTGNYISAGIGALLFITAFFQLKKKTTSDLQKEIPSIKDGILLGCAQGCTVLPGLSRSGITTSALLLLGFTNETALRLSFLMSMPIVFAGNILLNTSYFSFSLENTFALFFSFLFGIFTIHAFLKLAKIINFGYFVIVIGFFMMLSVAF